VSDLSHKPVHKGNTVTGPSPFWAEHDAELRRYAEQGLTTKAAAEALGVTKNAVIGRARRVGIVWARQPMGGRAKRRIEMQQRSWNFPPPGMCVYPLGHPTEPGFHFCSMPVERGKPTAESITRNATSPPPRHRPRARSGARRGRSPRLSGRGLSSTPERRHDRTDMGCGSMRAEPRLSRSTCG
jgi:GcrA cell cycle regulator